MRCRLLLTAIGLAAIGLCGCTLVGFGIGKAVDNSRNHAPKPLVQQDLLTLDPGEPLEVQLWDGTRLSGRFQGLHWISPEEYGPTYETARAGPAPNLPRLGPGAVLVKTNGQLIRGEYRGIGPGFVALGETGGRLSTVDFDMVMTLTDASGDRIAGRDLGALVEDRRVPLVTGISLEQWTGNRIVDSGQVASLSLPARRGGTGAARTGLIVGAVVDVAMVVALAIAASQPWDSPSTTTTTSCPLIDSFDGREWRLDAEPLGGAIYRAAERTDVARLDHVAEANGEYRLRLRNEQQEIDHVDAVALRVIDHAPGTEVVPDANGRVHVVNGGLAPVSGRGLPSARRGRGDTDLASLLARTDDDLWVSDAWGREASVPEDLRDGVELEYPRPKDGAAAVLVVRAGATAYAGRVLRSVLALHGRDLSRFYARLEAEPAARAAFERAREREVLPTVRVWDGREWRTAGFLRDLPSLVRRDQAVPLDRPEVGGDTLRVRIDGPPGLWSIDRAVVAWEGSGRYEQERLAPVRATREDGADVTELLSSADGRRHSLRPLMDAVTLRFLAPPRRPGRLRSVLVEATGYYNVVVPAEGEPQRLAFRRLVEEEGAVARFALERMRPGRAEEARP